MFGEIVHDSSLYRDSSSYLNINSGEMRIGIVISEVLDNDNYKYLVESYSLGRRIVMKCSLLSRFGDIYNYEEWNPRSSPDLGIPKTATPDSIDFSKRVGDVVVVACLNNVSYDGVILGSLKHPGRKTELKEKEISYMSEFNGLKTSIDNDGAYKVEFQGTPINVSLLDAPLPSAPPPPQYNPTIKGSYFEFDKDGNFIIGDMATTMPQSITINKTDGQIEIVSGDITITLIKQDGLIEVSADDIEIVTSNSVKIETSETEIKSTDLIKIESAKIAIGSGGTELIDSLIQLITAFGSLIINSPTGPCTPFQASPQWSQIETIKSKLNSIKGSL